jgi:hypothetical protein
MRIARRVFMASILGLLALPLLYGGTWWWRHARGRDVTHFVRAIVKKHFRGMNVSDATIDHFVADYAPELPASWGRLAAWAGLVAPIYAELDIFRFVPRYADTLRVIEDRVATQFLLSTDFYQNGADLGREVAYLGLYDPLERPCLGMFLRG